MVEARFELRKLVLKVLLWSLAFAAAAGVLAVLVTSDVIWRVMGTGFLTAGGALLTLPFSLMVDRPKSRSAGLLGIAAVVVEFILILMLIWEADRVLPGRRVDEQLLITTGVVAGSAVAAMVFLLAVQRPDARLAGWVGLGVTVAFFLAAMTATWVPLRWDEEWWFSAATVAAFGLLSVAALVGVGSGDRRHWRWLGVAASVVAAVLLLTEIWARGVDDKIVSLFVAVSIYIAYANLVARVPLTPGQRWLRGTTLAAGAATAILSELIVFDVGDDIVMRLDGAASILTACGTLALAVLARLNRRVDFDSRQRELLRITLFCPRCRRKQTIELGGSACKACGLRIEVQTEEPRCRQCGYLLYKLTSDTCPECGTPIHHDAPPTTG